jgi:hypothetical protein
MDLDMESGEVPILSTLVLPDSRPKLMPVALFIVNNVVFNRVNYVHMGWGYHQCCIENATLGLQPPVGTLSFPGGRGPVAHDPQDLQQVNNLMDQVVWYQQWADITWAAEFIGQIYTLWRIRQGGCFEHHQAAIDRWEAMPAQIQKT